MQLCDILLLILTTHSSESEIEDESNECSCDLINSDLCSVQQSNVPLGECIHAVSRSRGNYSANDSTKTSNEVSNVYEKREKKIRYISGDRKI